MKKVAFLLCSDTVGGHEYQSIELLLSFRTYCYPTLFLNVPQQKKIILHKNIDYIQCITPFFVKGNFFRQLFLSVKKRKYLNKLLVDFDDIVVCAGSVEAGICAGYALKKKNLFLYVPVYVDRIQIWGRLGFLYNMLLGIFIYPYRQIITINEQQSRPFLRYKKDVIIVPNRIKERLVSIDKMGGNEKRRLYFVGRLEKPKRLIELIKWLDVCENRFKEFIIIGEGTEAKRIDKLRNKLKYIKIILTGWLNNDEQEQLLSSNDILITNSAYEGEPLIIREANQRGSIVIARDILGHRGCTHKENRFRNKRELLSLLELAYDNKLEVFVNPSANEIEVMRRKAIERLFM